MGTDLWNHAKFLHHKVRNMTRRGWLLKTYNDKKMLRGRIKTDERTENDQIDIMHPVGYIAHVKPSEKTEVVTMDIGGDTSRRVIAWVMGDREYHPQPDENEAFVYAPGEKKQFLRIKKKREQSAAGFASDQDSSGNKDSGRKTGMHWDQLEEPVTGTTKNSFQNNADKGQGFSTSNGSFEIDAGQNTQFQASKHIRKGATYRDGDTFTNGTEHAADHVAGGGATISTSVSRADGEDHPDGSQPWSAIGRPGTTSLLATASTLANFQQAQTSQNQSTNAAIEDLQRRVAALEQKVGP